jgi:hypothetical protein
MPAMGIIRNVPQEGVAHNTGPSSRSGADILWHQYAVSPEQHIGSILSEAKRENSNASTPGWSTPLLYSHDGRVGARPRLIRRFDTAGGKLGDSIRVNVQTQEGKRKVRTYSVMRAAPRWRVSGVDSADAVTSSGRVRPALRNSFLLPPQPKLGGCSTSGYCTGASLPYTEERKRWR